MTNELSAWLNGVPVIAFGDPEFGAWLGGAPFVDAGDATGGGPGILGGARIVSPRRERVQAMVFAPWHVRLVSPKISIGRSPL